MSLGLSSGADAKWHGRGSIILATKAGRTSLKVSPWIALTLRLCLEVV